MKHFEEKAACLFLANRDFVKKQTLRYAPFPGISEDIFQEVFLEFVTKSDRWDLDGDIRPLLVYLVKQFAHRAIDNKKKNSHEKLGLIIEQIRGAAENWEDRDEFASYEEQKNSLKTCLDLLPRRSRELIDLYYFKGLSAPKIAEQMLLSTNAVYLAIHRIRQRLKKCIHKISDRIENR